MHPAVSLIAGARRLSWRERRQVARALGWLLATHAGLLILPYRTLRGLVGRLGAPARGRLTLGECASAVARAGRLFPPARCLTRALAAECLLRRSGHPAQVRFAAGFGPSRAFEAHAWLESDGTVVVGGAAASHLMPLA